MKRILWPVACVTVALRWRPGHARRKRPRSCSAPASSVVRPVSGSWAVGVSGSRNGRESAIPTGDVAVIDFSGSTRPVERAGCEAERGAARCFCLRNGQALSVQLSTSAARTSMRITCHGERASASFPSEIAALYVSSPSGARPPAARRARSRRVREPSGCRPTRPGADGVDRRAAVDADRSTYDGRAPRSAAATSRSARCGQRLRPAVGPGARRADSECHCAGALVGRIGNGEPFAIGNQTSVAMPESGQLFLGVNDDHAERQRRATSTCRSLGLAPTRRRRKSGSLRLAGIGGDAPGRPLLARPHRCAQ